jgi:type I restriction enzyme M protein
MALIGDGRGGIFCENALERPSEWGQATQLKIALGTFDVVVTNPPFGSKIAVKGSGMLSQYQLGRKWTKNKESGNFEQTTTLEAQRPPQILFIERCLQLLKPGGRMGIILPESILGNPSYGYLLDYLALHSTIFGIVTLPESLFKTSGKGGTHTKVAAVFLRKGPSPAKHEILMSDVKWCGHDSRGNPTLRKDSITGIVGLLDEVPLVAGKFKLLKTMFAKGNHLGYKLSASKIQNKILVPKYYDPEITAAIAVVKTTHDTVTIDELIKEKVLTVKTGVEPGKMAYGTGPIPFIRTSDLSNWEIKADFKHGVSEEIYNEWRNKVDVIAGDILMVRDGTYLIGTSAIVTESDLPMLFQSHLFRIRVLKTDELNPWLLFACLNAPLVKRQIKAKQFTQDIIDTLGKRLGEIVIPIPRDPESAKRIAAEVEHVIQTRARMRKQVKDISLSVQGIARPGIDDLGPVLN